MSDNTKNRREELNTILTKILDRGWWWFKSKIFKLHPKLPERSPSIQHHVIKLVYLLFARHSR